MSTQTAQTPAEANLWEDGIESLFSQMSELPTFWRDQARDAISPTDDGFVTLFITEDRTIGEPDTRLGCDLTKPQGQEFEPEITELHTLTLQVQVETYDNRARHRGRFFCNRVRTRLHRESSRVALAKIATSLIDVSPILSAAAEIDNRQSSASTMLVRLHAATIERDKPFGYIDIFRLQPTITDDGGNVVTTTTIDINLPDP